MDREGWGVGPAIHPLSRRGQLPCKNSQPKSAVENGGAGPDGLDDGQFRTPWLAFWYENTKSAKQRQKITNSVFVFWSWNTVPIQTAWTNVQFKKNHGTLVYDTYIFHSLMKTSISKISSLSVLYTGLMANPSTEPRASSSKHSASKINRVMFSKKPFHYLQCCPGCNT